MAAQKEMIRIRLKAYDHQLIDQSAEKIEMCIRDRSIPGMDNPAWQYAAARHALYESGKSVELLACYEPVSYTHLSGTHMCPAFCHRFWSLRRWKSLLRPKTWVRGKTLMKQSIPLSRMNSRNWTYSRELQTQSSWILSAWE